MAAIPNIKKFITLELSIVGFFCNEPGHVIFNNNTYRLDNRTVDINSVISEYKK